MNLKFYLPRALAILLVGFASQSAIAQEQPASPAIVVDRVRFDRAPDRITGEQWLACTIEFTARTNPAEEPANRLWVDNVGLRFTIGYGDPAKNQGKLDFAYQASVSIISVELNSRREVTFFLPPEIMKRDRLRYGDPDFWVVELTINGTPVQATSASTSRSITDRSILDGFTRAANEHLGRTEGILQPAYLTPFGVTGRNSPTFKRLETPAR